MKKNDVSKPSYEIIATHAPVVPLDKREGTIYTYIHGITVGTTVCWMDACGSKNHNNIYVYIYCILYIHTDIKAGRK